MRDKQRRTSVRASKIVEHRILSGYQAGTTSIMLAASHGTESLAIEPHDEAHAVQWVRNLKLKDIKIVR